MYRRAIAVLAEHLGCEPTEQAVYARRLATDPGDYAASLLRATNTEMLLVDEGFPPAGARHQRRGARCAGRVRGASR